MQTLPSSTAAVLACGLTISSSLAYNYLLTGFSAFVLAPLQSCSQPSEWPEQILQYSDTPYFPSTQNHSHFTHSEKCLQWPPGPIKLMLPWLPFLFTSFLLHGAPNFAGCFSIFQGLSLPWSLCSSSSLSLGSSSSRNCTVSFPILF